MLHPVTWICLPGKECKTENYDNISGIYRANGTEVFDPLRFFSSGQIFEPFYNKYGIPIDNPFAYAAKSLQLSVHDFKGKIKGSGKHSGKKGLGYKGKNPSHKGSRSEQNAWPSPDVWASAELDWQEASWPSSHSHESTQEIEPPRTKSKIDPKRKGKGWIDPIGSKGRFGKGKGKILPDPPLNRGGGGSRRSSSTSNRAPAKQERTRVPEVIDLLDIESPTFSDYHDQWHRIKSFTQEEAASWLSEAESRAELTETSFPLKWPLPTKAAAHGGPDTGSRAHFEMAHTWKTATDKIFWGAFPKSAFCPGCWKSISLKNIEDDPSQVEERVISHIESKIWTEHESRPQVPLHPSPATWCHLIADRIANQSPDYDSDILEGVTGGVWAGDPSCGFSG